MDEAALSHIRKAISKAVNEVVRRGLLAPEGRAYRSRATSDAAKASILMRFDLARACEDTGPGRRGRLRPWTEADRQRLTPYMERGLTNKTIGENHSLITGLQSQMLKSAASYFEQAIMKARWRDSGAVGRAIILSFMADAAAARVTKRYESVAMRIR